MLIGNYSVYNANPGSAIGGVTDPTRLLKSTNLYRFRLHDNPSERRSKWAFQDGYYPPYSWALPIESGALSSHNAAKVTVSPTASLQGGVPISGVSTITVSATANGGLIVSSSGSATLTLSADGTLISVALASGSTTISLTGSALTSAIANVSGQASITLTPSAVITAIGYLSGRSTNQSEFSADALAQAVWDALLDDHQEEGSFGDRVRKILTTAKFVGLK